MFPMYVVSLAVFMQMTKVRAHQLLLDEGKLVTFVRSMGRAIFVSHQWVGSTSPDPDFSQLQVLQEALRNVMSGKVFISDNLISKSRGESTTLAAADFTAEPLFIWYDYFSCPQTLEGSDGELMKYDLSRAIESIPGYVEMCDHFVILAPTLKHVDQGSMMSFRSWNKRGWCRAERTARLLSTVSTSMIVIESPTRLEVSVPLETLWCPVGLGDFTVNADKKKVGHLMKLLLANKLQAILATGKFHDYRISLNLQSNLLKNLPIPPVADTLPSLQKDNNNNNNNSNNNNDNNNANNNSDLVPREDEQSATVQQFLHQNGFTSIHERDEGG
ncbi:unnamed protein product [Polarella glacialis]|uniref:Uncharacterized protein n=1 Tax=Polarella glacialis TaxID=89957 RepID=A0A813D9B3_POLGL|nr:unnamed protein product [Polarella glacialis]